MAQVHNPPDAQVFRYQVKPGYRHGRNKQFGPGDVVELTEFEAAGFADKLTKVGPVVAATVGVEAGPPDTDEDDEDESDSFDATDAAAELAAEHGVDLATVAGSGAGGRILVSDVEAVLVEA